MYYLISSVVVGDGVRPPPGNLGRALFSHSLLVFRGQPGVASWLSHEGLTEFEGGLGHELAPPLPTAFTEWAPLALDRAGWRKFVTETPANLVSSSCDNQEATPG